MQSGRLRDIPQQHQGSCPLLHSNRRNFWHDVSEIFHSKVISQWYVRGMPQHIYIQPGGRGCISNMSICRKTKKQGYIRVKKMHFYVKNSYVFMYLCFWECSNVEHSFLEYVDCKKGSFFKVPVKNCTSHRQKQQFWNVSINWLFHALVLEVSVRAPTPSPNDEVGCMQHLRSVSDQQCTCWGNPPLTYMCEV